MKIAVIGVGNVGGTLGARWLQVGHEVVFGARDPHSEKAQHTLKATGGEARLTSVEEAVAVADVVVLATPWTGTQDAIKSAGDLTGRIVIDCTNPIANGQLAVGHTSSGAEQVAAWTRSARVVKAFNTTGSGNMANPDYAGQVPTIFLCGDDAAAKKVVAGLVEELGLDPCDTGPLSMARYLEPLAMLWIRLAYGQGLGPNIAFRLLRR